METRSAAIDVPERARPAARWHAADLRWRLSAGIGAVLLLCLSVASAIAVREARNSVGEEMRAGIAAAESSLDITMRLLDAATPEAARSILQDWAQSYAYSRHLCVALMPSDAAESDQQCQAPSHLRAPAWFADGVGAIPAAVQRTWPRTAPQLIVRLVPMPDNEIGEAWSTVRSLLWLLIAMGFAINLLVFAWLSYALRPLSGIVAALERMNEGEFEVRLTRAPTPELQRLVLRLDALARQLSQARTQNRRLLLQRLGVQEDERRWVAHELHDEIGQHVAAIEVETVALQALAQGEQARTLREGLQRVRGLVGDVHCMSRRLIQRLRPPALDMLGLAASLRGLGEQWRRHHAGWDLQVEIDEACDGIGDELAIHVFRIVQEALSNVARHADASHVAVRVQLTGPVSAPSWIQIWIADDGRGFDVHLRRSGLGLAGLGERVDALRGSLQVESARGLGCRLHVRLPTSCASVIQRDAQLRAQAKLSDVEISDS